MTKKQRKIKVRTERRKTNVELKKEKYKDEPLPITWVYQKKDGGEWEKVKIEKEQTEKEQKHRQFMEDFFGDTPFKTE